MNDQEIALKIIKKFSKSFQVKSSTKIGQENYFKITMNSDGCFSSEGKVANKVTLFVETHYNKTENSVDNISNKLAVMAICLVSIYETLDFTK